MATTKVFSGIVWASIQRFGTMIISFATNIILARLLTPDDFGTIGMLLLFLAIANTFVDGGLGSALIQKKDANEEDFSTVFYINLFLSSILYTALFITAPWIASFYNVEILCPILRAQGLILILNAFSIIQTTILRKKMHFRELSICNIIGNLIGSALGISAALMDYGVWSLVIRALAVGFITSLLLWFIGKWKPELVLRKQSFKELFGFGGFMLLSNLIYNVSNNVQTLLIGKLFKPADLGNYTQARQLRNVITDSVSSVISQVLYPEFANHQTDNFLLSHKLNLSISVLSFLSVGLMSLCIVIAEPLIMLLYGQKWINCIVFFKILCLAGCFVPLQDININIVAAKGKSKILFYFNIVKMILFILFLLGGAKLYGLTGLVIGNTLYTIVAYLAFSLLSSFYLNISAWNQYKRILLTIAVSIIPSVMIYFLNFYLLTHHNTMLVICIDTIVFTLTYWLLSNKVKNEGCIYLMKLISNSLK